MPRYVLNACRTPSIQAPAQSVFPPGQTILLVGRESAFVAALGTKLMRDGYRVCRALPGDMSRPLTDGRFEVDFASPHAMDGLRQLLEERDENIGMVLNVADWTENAEAGKVRRCNESQQLLELLKACAPDLEKAARNGGGWLVNLTALDGQFGLKRGEMAPPGVAGTLGVAKTAAREWPELRVQCIDLDPTMAAEQGADRVSSELCAEHPLVEVGFTREGRWQLDLIEKAMEPPVALNLGAQSVFLVSGGAYGITAQAIRALAEKYRAHAIIVGRSPLPQAEAVEFQEIDDTVALKQRLIDNMTREDARVRPAQIERRLERILKDRQIRANLAALRQVCASVTYQALDVRDAPAFSDFIDGIYRTWGRIDGVIHGAGIIEDKRIRDKERDSFSRVFDTKVAPARVLADKLRPHGLRFLVFFGSVAGRFGNPGQADYSAANEELNKLAQALNRKWPETRVVSINWGPWDHGMTRPHLRRLFAAKGVRPIAVERGVRAFLDELAAPPSGPAEVVVTDSLEEIARAGA